MIYNTQDIKDALELVRKKMYELSLQRDRLNSMLKERKKEMDEVCYKNQHELQDAIASHILIGRTQRYVARHLGLSNDIVNRNLNKWFYRKNRDLYFERPQGVGLGNWIRDNKHKLEK